jgi:predicted secreted Zn-dependent protease
MLWQRSSFCGSGACVEVAVLRDGRYAVRSSTNSENVLYFTSEEWDVFLAGVRNDEFGKEKA